MTDGTTGTVGQSPAIAPVASEDEMSKLSALFSQAANAIVQASTLPAQIAKLQSEVEGYKHQVESLESNRQAMDQTINELRQQRDYATDVNATRLHRIEELTAQTEGLTSRTASAEQTITQLNDELERTRKERDQYGLDHMQALDDLKAVRDKLGQVKERFKELLAEPEAKPEPPVDVPNSGNHTPEPTPMLSQNEKEYASRMVEPLPPEAMPEISPALPPYIDEWEPGYSWDGSAGCYKRNH